MAPRHGCPRRRADRRRRWASPVCESRTTAKTSTCAPAAASCWAPAASNGTPKLVEAYLRGPMRGAVSPPNNTGDGLRMAMAHGADLANMGEAWWVPIVQMPGDTFDGPAAQPQRAPRTHPPAKHHRQPGGQAIPQRGGRIQLDGGPVPLPRSHATATLNDPAWIVFDSLAPQALRLSRRRPGRPGARLVLASRRTWPNWARRPASTPTAWPARCRRGTTTSPHEQRSRLRPRLKRLRRLLGRRHGHHAGGQDPRPHRHAAVLRGAGVDRRDGHQGRPAHRPRRPRAARQRRRHPRPVRRGQRDGGRDGQGLRRRGRDHRPRNGVRLPRRHGGVGASS